MDEQKDTQVIEKLRNVLEGRVPSNHYSLGGYCDDNICLENVEGKWWVYYGFRFQKDDVKVFDTIYDAGRYMIKRLMLLNDESDVKEAIQLFEDITLRKEILAEMSSENGIELKQAIEEAEELCKQRDRKTFDSFDDALKEINRGSSLLEGSKY